MECLGIERREHLAEPVMRRRAILERRKAAQQFELLLAEGGDVGPPFGTRQHSHQREQEDLVERIKNLARLGSGSTSASKCSSQPTT